MTSPTAPGTLDGFEYTSMADDEPMTDPAVSSTDSAASPAPGSSLTDSPASTETTADADPEASAPLEGAPADPDQSQPETLVFPEGGSPFTFRVDGNDAAPAGAKVYPDGSVLLPKSAWDDIRGNWLGHRGAWRHKEAQYQQRIAHTEQAAMAAARDQVETVELERDQARAALEEFREILEGGPEAVFQWAQQFEVNKPALQARMEARELKVQLDRATRQTQTYTARETEQQEAAKAAEWRPALEDHLRHAITTLAGTDEFKGVAATPEAVADLHGFLWETMADKLFYEKSENPQRLEDIGFRVDVLRTFLAREKKKADDRAAKVQTTVQSAVRNAGALAPTPHTGRKQATPHKGATAPKILDPDQEIGGREYF